MEQWKLVVTKGVLAKKDIYEDGATTIKVEDEGGGLFIILSQGLNDLRFDPGELKFIAEAADKMLHDAEIALGHEEEK